MEFRPCIDIHNGKVKQIVGGTLCDEAPEGKRLRVEVNFVSEKEADYYAKLYKQKGLKGGHVILLNSADSPAYEKTKEQALKAVAAFKGGLQVGGGISPANAGEFLRAGASHVIVTSYVFREGRIDYERLKTISQCVGREHLVLDLSCKKRNGAYKVVTDRWQHETNQTVNWDLLDKLSGYCDEFLIHAVDVEGKSQGIECALVSLLGRWGKKPVTYAGGVHNLEDLELLGDLGQGRVNATVGSALDIFGGSLNMDALVKKCKEFPIT